ncbi:uncharacterized protein LOC109837277 [Asparagus officinalis]|uniref:uncharacterized protein LOC109837277 n=1 Tax=Asparagus officinalis TaxID=4686 RepID=UPI00098E4522|nr:uncharacterized protein LOC109837277 [Asparagus officinalis]
MEFIEHICYGVYLREKMFQRKGLQVQLFEGILHLNGFILIFKWGSLKVRWDEHANIQRPKRVKFGSVLTNGQFDSVVQNLIKTDPTDRSDHLHSPKLRAF